MMNKAIWVALGCLLIAGCTDTPSGPADITEEDQLLGHDGHGVVLDRRAPVERVLHKLYRSATRREIADGIAHYQFTVPLGPGPFDVVRLHRVVRERQPYHPAPTTGGVMMTHGASLNFEVFLRLESPDQATRTSAAAYLASHGVDVWGLDFAWALIPPDVTDFSFLKSWGVERDVDHTLAALSIARLIRGKTGQGFGRLHLLGYSYGVGVAYAAAGRETQQHAWLRDIDGILAVDLALKLADADESSRLAACADAASSRELIDAGVYQNDDGLVFAFFSSLAATAPDDPSPIFEGLTNFQAILFIGANTFAFGDSPAPFWHFVAGDFNEFGIPVGLLYTDPAVWITGLGSLSPYMPRLANFELAATACDEADLSIDDHLAAIEVPILYLGAAGAFGTLGDYTSSLTASNDVTNVTVQLQPADQAIIDYGHGDLFLARDAADHAWDVLRRWLLEHSNKALKPDYSTMSW